MMQVHLPQELETFVRRLVDDRLYVSADEVVHHALGLLKDQTDLRAVRLADLRKQIAVGLEQAERGESIPLDMKALQGEAARLLLQEQERETEACPR